MRSKVCFYLTILFFSLFWACSDDNSDGTDGYDIPVTSGSPRNADTTPAALKAKPVQGRMISFKTPKGEKAGGYLVTPDSPSNKYLLVFHEWWGLNDYIKEECRYYCKALGVNVLGVDLYDGKVTDDPTEAARLKENAKPSRMQNITEGAIAYTGRSAQLATLGWCFGGHWSLEAGITAEKKALACVIYYGMPETDINKLQKLSAPVLGIFANKDQVITPKMVNEFESRMQAVNRPMRIQRYDQVHAFANPSNPKFAPEDAADAKMLTLKFLKEQFASVK